MPRLTPSAPASGNHYRNFAIGVMAVAAIIALATEGSSSEAVAPASPSRLATEARKPTASLAPDSHSAAWAADEVEVSDLSDSDPSVAAEGETEQDGKVPGPPKPGKRGPASQPTPEQLAMLIATSRERSGAPPDGD